MSGKVEVTQADRDAVSDWLQSIDVDNHLYNAIRRGEGDLLDVVQAFARHRTQSTAPRVAELEDEIARLRAQLIDSDLDACKRAVNRMGWPEINAYNAELRKGQDVREDAGGYLLRCLKALFGVKHEEQVENYQDAANAMVDEAARQALGAAK